MFNKKMNLHSLKVIEGIIVLLIIYYHFLRQVSPNILFYTYMGFNIIKIILSINFIKSEMNHREKKIKYIMFTDGIIIPLIINGIIIYGYIGH